MDVTAGHDYIVKFPQGMHKADFAKCLTMARKLGRYSAPLKSWIITPAGSHGTACVHEMIDRGARVHDHTENATLPFDW